jgi:hypothetical protein
MQTKTMLSSRSSTIIGIESNMSSAGAASVDAILTEQFVTPQSYSRPTASRKTGFTGAEPATGFIRDLRNGCTHEMISTTRRNG